MKENHCQAENIIIKRIIGSHHLRLSVNKRGQIVLRIPFFCPKGVAMRFLDSHQNWIAEQKQKRRARLVFQNGMPISILGQSVVIQHCPEKRAGVYIDGENLIVSGDAAFLNRRVSDFVKRRTAQYIDALARQLAGKIDQKINKITLKDTTSRWGSCSGKKNLNFCWRLGLAPKYVLDYIVAHEVAHLQEMNHSPAFWRVVSQLCDRRSDAEIWLRRQGHTLR